LSPLQPPLQAPHVESAQQISSSVQSVDQGAVASQAKQAPINPVLSLYRDWTLQYAKDATEANKAAQMYAKMSQSLLNGPLKQTTASLTQQEMGRIGIKTWGHAVYEFEKMLQNDGGTRAAAAAAKAAAPYNKLVGDYVKAQGIYDSTAMGYALRITLDVPLAKKLVTYANQYRLQGDNKMADNYDNQASSLMGQAENMARISKGYFKTAMRLNAIAPGIQKMAGIAGAKAAYMVGPPVIPQSHLFPFTPVPPLEFAQTGSHTKVVHAEESAHLEPATVPPPMPPSKFLGK
jgi:hypothetical protein